MKSAAEKLEFEKAAEFRNRIKKLQEPELKYAEDIAWQSGIFLLIFLFYVELERFWKEWVFTRSFLLKGIKETESFFGKHLR